LRKEKRRGEKRREKKGEREMRKERKKGEEKREGRGGENETGRTDKKDRWYEETVGVEKKRDKNRG
jgi:hypothetical protein